MSELPPRTLRTIAGAGGCPGPYELAIDPGCSALDTAITVARRAEAARIDALSQEPLVFVGALSQVTRHAV